MIFQEERQSEMLDLALLIQSVAALQALDYNLVQRNIPRIRNSASQTNLMGLYQWNQMNLEGAVTTFERLDRILSNADASQKLQNSGNLSLLYQELGRTRDAVRRANEVDDFRRETRDKRLDMFGDQIRGARHRLVGETKQALAVLEACISRSKKESLAWPPIYENASECLLDLDRVDLAMDYCLEAAKMRQKAGVRPSAPVLARGQRLRKRFVARLGRDGYAQEVRIRLKSGSL